MDKLAFPDIGELGWSLYLSAHIRWLKKNKDVSIAVITHPDRQCLYYGLADIVCDVPKVFYRIFKLGEQNCFGLLGIPPRNLRQFFSQFLPMGYAIPEWFPLTCEWFFGDRVIFEPYPYKQKLDEGDKEILVFPRYRQGKRVLRRNLPKKFYADLIVKLCDEFPYYLIRTIGTTNGAYDIELGKSNYLNWVGKGKTLQDLIDRCQIAVVAIGSQSAPPKLTLLQGTASYIIGHQKKRHMEDENWLGTKVGFWQIKDGEYETFKSPECIDKIINFVKESNHDRKNKR